MHDNRSAACANFPEHPHRNVSTPMSTYGCLRSVQVRYSPGCSDARSSIWFSSFCSTACVLHWPSLQQDQAGSNLRRPHAVLIRPTTCTVCSPCHAQLLMLAHYNPRTGSQCAQFSGSLCTQVQVKCLHVFFHRSTRRRHRPSFRLRYFNILESHTVTLDCPFKYV